MKNSRSANHFFLVLLLASATLVFFVFRPYLASIILGASLAVIFARFSGYLEKRLKLGKTIGAFLVTLFALLIILLPATFYGIKIVQEAGQAYSTISGPDFGGVFESFVRKIQTYLPWLPAATADIQNYLKTGLNLLVNNFGALFSGVMDLAVSFLISLITLYVLLKNSVALKKKILEWSPLPTILDEEIINKMHLAVSSVIKGTLGMAIIQGLVAGIGFIIFGVPQPMLWVLACVFASLIPIVGSGLVTVPSAIYLFFFGSPIAALGMLLWGTFLVGTIDNIIRPLLMEKGIDAHPFLILLSVLGGISFFGPIGFLLGPVLVTLLFTLLDSYPRIAVAE